MRIISWMGGWREGLLRTGQKTKIGLIDLDTAELTSFQCLPPPSFWAGVTRYLNTELILLMADFGHDNFTFCFMYIQYLCTDVLWYLLFLSEIRFELLPLLMPMQVSLGRRDRRVQDGSDDNTFCQKNVSSSATKSFHAIGLVNPVTMSINSLNSDSAENLSQDRQWAAGQFSTGTQRQLLIRIKVSRYKRPLAEFFF